MTWIPALLRASMGYISAFLAGAVTFNGGSDNDPKPFKVPGIVLGIVFVILAIWILRLLKVRVPIPKFISGSSRRFRSRARRTFSRARRRVRRSYRRVRRRVSRRRRRY